MSAHVTSHPADARPANTGGGLRLFALVLVVWALLAAIAWFAPFLGNIVEKTAPPPAVIRRATPAPAADVAPPPPTPAPAPRRVWRPVEDAGVSLNAPHATGPTEEFDVLSASELAAISQDRTTAP